MGILCRNHRYFVEAVTACRLLGANGVLLSTAFAPPQLRDVVLREDPSAIIVDHEFLALLDAAELSHTRWIAWPGPEPGTHETLEDFAAEPFSGFATPRAAGSMTLLTSGTTGVPKGARPTSRSWIDLGLVNLAKLVGRLGLHLGGSTLIASPVFHALGMTHLNVAHLLATRIVLHRHFDAERTLSAIQEHRITGLVLVPILMQRILALGVDVIRRYDTSSLRFVCVSGSSLPGSLAAHWMDVFGDHLCNLFGSTEVGPISVATSDELRRHPGTVGRPIPGIDVQILTSEGDPAPAGQSGRIFVRSPLVFRGYTSGESKEIRNGFMSSGDLGYFNGDGLLFVCGRDDEMIVSGAEKVFPSEVEDLLASHPCVVEVAVVGVPDHEFGQRLRALIVPAPGSALSADEIKAYVRERLARYKVPRDVVFVESLPRNAAGKILKRHLLSLEPEVKASEGDR